MAINSPNDIASLVAWYDAQDASSITDTAGDVTQIDNKSTTVSSGGVAWDLSVAGSGNEVLTGSRLHNGHNVLDFRAGKYLVMPADSALSQPNTIIALLQFDTVADFAIDGLTGSTQHVIFRSGAGATSFFAGTSSLVEQNSISGDTVMRTQVAVYNTTSSRFITDGNAATPDGSLSFGSDTLTGLTMGARNDGLSQLDGAIAEVMVFDEALSQGDIDDVEAYLTAKWTMFITINEPVEFSGVQREGGASSHDTLESGDLPLGHTATAIEVEIVDQDNNVHQAYTLVDSSPGATSWSGTLNIPLANKRFKRNARYVNEPSKLVTGVNESVIGDKIVVQGQSNGSKLFDETGNPVTSQIGQTIYQGAGDASLGVGFKLPIDTDMPGANGIAATVIPVTGVAMMLVNSAESGSGLFKTAVDIGHWAAVGDDFPSSDRRPHDNAMTDKGVIGDEVATVVWLQHTADAPATTESEYFIALRDLVIEARTDPTNKYVNKSGRPNLPYIIVGNVPGFGTDDQFQGINNAKLSVFNGQDDIWFVDIGDLSLQDGQHLDAFGLETCGERIGLAINSALANTGEWRGPKVSHLTSVSDTQTDVTIIQTLGTDFTPASGDTNWGLFQKSDDTDLNVSAAVQQDSTTIRLTHDSSVEALYGQYAFGNPDQDTYLTDNSPTTLALRPTLFFDQNSGVPMITTPYGLDIAPGEPAEDAAAGIVSTIVAGNMKIFLGSGVDPAKRQSIRGSLKVIYNFMMNNAGKGEVTSGDIVVFGDYLNVNQDTITLTNVTAGIGVNDVAIVVSSTFGSAANQTIEYREGFRKLTAQLLTRSAAN